MVDGTPLHIGPIIRKLRVVLGPITVRRDFDSATLDGYDFIFGRDWLRTVSTQFDWAQRSCSVKVDGEFRELPQWSDGATSSTAIINAVRVRQLVKRAARIFAVFLEEVEAEEGKGGSAAVSEKATLPAETIATFTGLRAAPAKVAVAKSVVSFTPRAQRLSISCAASPDTLTKVRGIIAQQLAVEVEKITADAKFVDLGADSLDTSVDSPLCWQVEIMMALEEQFDITLDEEGAEKISTVQEAADLIEEQVAKA
ncbi:unnamed protein product [Closterium sp. NIES-64]|nr:unnamed protein product [Closterium sp. NIES-64]CAI5990824.1 unnamed protein product [Closterium sp. NIES-64]